MEQTQRPLSGANKKQLACFLLLQENLPVFMQRKWFKKDRTAKEIAEYCMCVAEAKVGLWAGVGAQYPETLSGTWEIVNGELRKL